MQKKNTSIVIVASIVLALGLLVYFIYQPLLNNINLGLDLRGGL
ncbi:MAG: protein translocase subunit SecD, partial [Syntrophomonadaceae bacterium]|nr:protein translocase subunit SecD [Syntrophomonadaceae bacterium]